MAGDVDGGGEVCVCSGACHVYNSVVATDTEATCVSQQAAPQLLLLFFHSIISRRVCLYNVPPALKLQADPSRGSVGTGTVATACIYTCMQHDHACWQMQGLCAAIRGTFV
jgi:hypothetical protein